MSRVILFFCLAFRPHPYAYPCSAWRAWTTHFVGPREAWRIAGVLSDCPAYRED
jgi:hypothetical protein